MMTNHWESSTRPLFVKTVYVNGNRHAILSPQDPLLHSGVFSAKRQRRPNSSMSTSSITSISSSEYQDSISVEKVKSLKTKNVRDRHRKNMSPMLQDCFVKLKLTNTHQEMVRDTKNDISSGNSQENPKGGYNETHLIDNQQKMNHSSGDNHKCCRHCDEVSSKENKLAEVKKESNHSCYVYDFETNKRRKNYSFVKIASGKSSQGILDCSCEKNICGSNDCLPSDKNNYVISATVHNLIMEADQNENQLHNLLPIGDSNSYELPQKNSQTRSYYNPLSERVVQWLDLARKKKTRKSLLKTNNEDDTPLGDVERISAGKTFIDEHNKSKYCEKSNYKAENKSEMKKEKVMQREISDEDVETEVKGEENVETILSMQTSNNFKCFNEGSSQITYSESKELAEEKFQSNQALKHAQPNQDLKVTSIPTKIDPNSLMTAFLKNSIADRLNFNMFAINVEDLAQKTEKDGQSEFSCENKNKFNQKLRNCVVRGSKSAEVGSEGANENKKFKISSVKFWRRNEPKKNSISFENVCETTACHCVKNNKECEKTVKNQNLNDEFEKCQKSINNPNITRSRSVSQNLYPQQQNKASWLGDKKTVWLSEKNMIRPQLHIFIPSLPSKDPANDALSECESLSNEVP